MSNLTKGEMKMSIYYCPSCNKKYFLDCEIDDEFENNFKCEFCGHSKSSNKSIKTNVTNEQKPSDTIKNQDELLSVEYRKLDLLKDIHKMMKFFYITSIVGIALLVLSFLLQLGNL